MSNAWQNRAQPSAPLMTWAGMDVLWLGTSIPNQGTGVDSYPELFGVAMGCNVTNNAWPGSHATYDAGDSAASIGTIKALSMTEDDRLAGLALHGPTSVYDDSFDPPTLASEMTCDHRIKAAFAATAFDVVVLDHARNDRNEAAGTLEPPSAAIVAITKGAQTTVETSSVLVAAGEAVALEVEGITGLTHFAGRVQSVDGASFTLNLDTSAYAGEFVSGTAIKLNRATFYGAFEFLIHYTRWAGALHGVADVPIVLAGNATEYDNNSTPAIIRRSAGWLRALADKWGLLFNDMAPLIDIKSEEHLTYFPDGVHPTTTAARQTIANRWADWARGASVRRARWAA
jgi:hypothetical protein